MIQDNEEYLTANETIQVLRISRKTLDRYVERGTLRKYRRGIRIYFKKSEVEEINRIVPDTEVQQ